MQIIIGRDAKTSQLNVIIGQQTLRLGAPGSVPQTVSRQHCRITVTEGGTYLVENLKAANDTHQPRPRSQAGALQQRTVGQHAGERSQLAHPPRTVGHEVETDPVDAQT